MGTGSFKTFVKQYWVAASFPLIAAGCIFADWNHTRLWKKEVAKQKQLELINS